MIRAITVLALCVITVALCQLSPPVKAGSEAGVVLHLPASIGRLVGSGGEPSSVEKANLPEDTEFAKMTYHTATDSDLDRDIAHVSVVLAGAERRSIHRPEVCLTGQGWTVSGKSIRTIQIREGASLRVTDLSIERTAPDQSGKRLRGHYVYWFVGTDVTTPSHTERIWLTTMDSILRNTNHRWAYASVMSLVTEGLDPAIVRERPRTDEETGRLLDYIISRIVPAFQKGFMDESALASVTKHNP